MQVFQYISLMVYNPQSPRLISWDEVAAACDAATERFGSHLSTWVHKFDRMHHLNSGIGDEHLEWHSGRITGEANAQEKKSFEDMMGGITCIKLLLFSFFPRNQREVSMETLAGYFAEAKHILLKEIENPDPQGINMQQKNNLSLTTLNLVIPKFGYRMQHLVKEKLKEIQDKERETDPTRPEDRGNLLPVLSIR